MGTTFAQSSIFSVQVGLLAPIISFALALALFGFYTLLFGLSFYFLYQGKSIPGRNLHLASTISLFLISTLGGLISASSGIDDVVALYRTLLTQDLDAFIKFANQDETETVMVGLAYTCMIIANVIADSVFIHRIYLVWGSRIWIIVIPVLASLATNVVGLAGTIMRTKGFSNAAIPANFALELKGINYTLGFYYANAVVNFLLTLMIAARIWWVGMRTSISFGGDGRINKKYKQIIAILLECGIIYPISLIAHAAIEGSTSTIAIPVNLTATVILLAGIAPTLIILCTCVGRSISQRIIDSQSATVAASSSLHFPSQGRQGSTKNISSLVHVQSRSQSSTMLHSAQNIEVEVEMKRMTAEV